MDGNAAGQGPLERPVVPLLERLRSLEAMRRREGDEDAADLCREVWEELHNLAWALSLPGFDRMATDEDEAAHQEGMRRVNDMLARMEKAKAEHDADVRDAVRWRHLLRCVMVDQSGGYVVHPDEPNNFADSIGASMLTREVDAEIAGAVERERHNAKLTCPPRRVRHN